MGIIEGHVSARTFLEYDFEKGKSEGKILCVGTDEGGHPILKIENYLSVSDKFSLIGHEGKSLKSVVEYLQSNVIPKDASNVSETNLNKWKVQCAHLENKVQKHNQQYGRADIIFNNPFLDKLLIKVTLPIRPESYKEELRYETTELEILYTPFTTFKDVEKVVKNHLGPERIYKEGKKSDRYTIYRLAKANKQVSKWLSENPKSPQLHINYEDIDGVLYDKFIHEKGFIEGFNAGSRQESTVRRPNYSLLTLNAEFDERISRQMNNLLHEFRYRAVSRF